MYETRTYNATMTPPDEAHPRRLTGIAVVYDQDADLGKFVERVKPGALTRSLASGNDVKARYEHRDLLASTRNGTLQLRDTPKGLEVIIDVAETRAGDDVLALVRRGDIAGMSFGFNIATNGQSWTRSKGKPVRELTELVLGEVSVTDNPAYQGTAIHARSISQAALDEADKLAAMPTIADHKNELRRLEAQV